MPLKVTEDTFATEEIGGVEVRRKVKAGQLVPDNWSVEGGTEEVKGSGVLGEGYEPVTGPEDNPTSQEAPLSQLGQQSSSSQADQPQQGSDKPAGKPQRA
jgi:hypothetical protein